MPLISDSTGILRPQEAMTFIDRFQKSIAARITGMEGKEALQLLHDIRGNLVAEESAVHRSVAEIEDILQRLAIAGSIEETGIAAANFRQLAADQFSQRASVSTYHANCSRFMTLLISHAITSAADMLTREGKEIPGGSWCALASGKLGRGETGRMNFGQVILLAEDSADITRETFNEFAYRAMAILEQLLPAADKGAGPDRRPFWSGTAADWLEFVDAGLSGRRGSGATSFTSADADLFSDTFSLAADLRPLCGSLSLAATVVDSSSARVAHELAEEHFRQFVIRTTGMPVAIGIFGRFKTLKSGRHRGKFSLEDLAINPLVAATRVLAVSSGITDTATVARIKAILAAGNLGVAHADRLLKAYYDFEKMLIECELAEKSAGEKIFLNPDEFDEPTRERFRTGLEEVTTLQRLVYQQLVEAA